VRSMRRFTNRPTRHRNVERCRQQPAYSERRGVRRAPRMHAAVRIQQGKIKAGVTNPSVRRYARSWQTACWRRVHIFRCRPCLCSLRSVVMQKK
jgi:hypothetical protein